MANSAIIILSCGNPTDNATIATPANLARTVAAAAPTDTPSPTAAATADAGTEVPSPTVAVNTPAPTLEPKATPVDIAALPRFLPSTTVDQGGAYYIEPFVVTLPPGRAFRLEASLNDPGGTLLYLLRDVTTGSTLKLDPQLKRIDGLVVTDPTVSGMFDEIVASLIVVSQ